MRPLSASGAWVTRTVNVPSAAMVFPPGMWRWPTRIAITALQIGHGKTVLDLEGVFFLADFFLAVFFLADFLLVNIPSRGMISP